MSFALMVLGSDQSNLDCTSVFIILTLVGSLGIVPFPMAGIRVTQMVHSISNYGFPWFMVHEVGIFNNLIALVDHWATGQIYRMCLVPVSLLAITCATPLSKFQCWHLVLGFHQGIHSSSGCLAALQSCLGLLHIWSGSHLNLFWEEPVGC